MQLAVCSGFNHDSDSRDNKSNVGTGVDRRGIKHERSASNSTNLGMSELCRNITFSDTRLFYEIIIKQV